MCLDSCGGILEIGTIIVRDEMSATIRLQSSIGKCLLALMLVGVTTVGHVRPTFASLVAADDISTTTELKSLTARDRFQQGLTAINAGNLDRAIVHFDRAIELDPTYLQAYIERGNIKDTIGDLPGAVADFTKAIAIDPKSSTAYYNRGTVLSKNGSITAAIADYTAAIAIDPRYAAAYLNRANNLDDLGKSASAFADYERAIAILPNYALAYLNRGIAYERKGNRPKAVADLNRAAELFKTSGDRERYRKVLKMLDALKAEG